MSGLKTATLEGYWQALGAVTLRHWGGLWVSSEFSSPGACTQT